MRAVTQPGAGEKLVTAATCTFAYEAAIVQGRLESAGIPCFVQDACTIQINPFLSNALGGVKVQVQESDLAQAVELLRETGDGHKGDGQPSGESAGSHPDHRQPAETGAAIVCPMCGSDEVVPSRKAGWFFLLTSLVVGCPSPFLRRMYHCFHCHHDFKRTKA